MPEKPREFSTPELWMDKLGDLFTPRQLVALTTFSDLVQEARAKVKADALIAVWPMTDQGWMQAVQELQLMRMLWQFIWHLL